MSYYRHVKNWLLELFPDCHAAIEERLREMARILEKYLMKRASGGVTKHAAACTKNDLSLLVRYLYTHATSPTDYQDVALVTVLWYVFGRASDFSLVQKESVSVCSRNNFFVRLVRVKTSDQQGLTLHPDNDITTCPILAIAVSLVMQSAPCTQLLEHVRPTPIQLDLEAVESLPLAELLMHAEQEEPPAVAATATKTKKPAAPPGIHNQINRLLARIAKPAGVLAPLSSHSFRRGGAQHANGEAGMSMQWVSDRGGWNLSTQNKVWSYVFNTTQEDQRVSKVLSGWDSNAKVPLDRLDALDGQASAQVRVLQAMLFNTCSGMQDRRVNICPQVLDACTSRLIRALPILRTLHAGAPIIARVDACAAQAGIGSADLLALAVALEDTRNESQQLVTPPIEHKAALDLSSAILQELITTNRQQALRIEVLEAKADPAVAAAVAARREAQVQQSTICETVATSAPRKKTPAAHLSVVWFEWYAGEPRLWSLSTDVKKRSEGRRVVAFMKLFLTRNLVLDASSATYRDDVMTLGVEAEYAVDAFLREQGIKSKGSSAVLKHMRALYDRGKLNEYVAEYKARLAIGLLLDPSPRDSHDILGLVTSISL